jgi:hypothetical protein
MAFPSNPGIGAQITLPDGTVFTFNGTAWDRGNLLQIRGGMVPFVAADNHTNAIVIAAVSLRRD